ncbi:magnesium-translocating P-type ATPase [Chelatococcus sambhunathii]|uniref:Magnesium-transporting ATPase, P-type 1 n=1 Tax=Chelatococcus sambhunathii TaxID=363953 RepID=A0ABU1DGL5_9HYPH|nr:magnesium-translocating P-type ATPase [Chelatococcus sambhunathii]MDR4307246.1 magnesium-translocating P-type ATPase [Chelatococcus sambhunathii]
MDAAARLDDVTRPGPARRDGRPAKNGAEPQPFWSVPVSQGFAELGVSRAGLSSVEAKARLARFGPNEAPTERRKGILRGLLRRLMEPLVALLLIAAVLAGVVGDFVSSGIIAVVVLLSVALETWQEGRAQAAAEALKRSVAMRAAVMRDGIVVEVPVARLVPGDVVELHPGDIVPADGWVVESQSMRVDEAALTGEPYPVEKRLGPSGARTRAEAYDAVFAGGSVLSGAGVMLVAVTGAGATLGAVEASLESEPPPTAFQRGLADLGRLIVRLTILLVAFVIVAQVAFERPLMDAFLFALALAVGVTPELLPMVTTMTLSRGAVRLAERRVICKALPAIHDLGAMDVLCTDKTGTLTEARIELASALDIEGRPSARVLALASAGASLGGDNSPLVKALAAARPAAAEEWRVLCSAPFDFQRRRSSVLAEKAGDRLIIVKGAPEAVLAACRTIKRAGQTRALEDDARLQALRIVDEAAGRGLRCLAVATGTPSPAEEPKLSPADERGLTLEGLCFFADPVKPTSREAIARLAAMGVRIKILSGDAPAVVAHVAREVGLPPSSVLSGDQVAGLSDAALAETAAHVDLFARLEPEQKVRVVRALSATGSTVGFLGDGINDAPAIRAADVGLSVDGATDVARSAADLILLEGDLGVLAEGVQEGRRTHANILKYIRMATSSNFGNMISMAIASVALPFLPLAPAQVLLNNLLYDVSEAGIPYDSVDPDEARAPHGWDIARIYRFTLVMGLLSSAFDLASFAILRLLLEAPEASFQTAWFIESMITQILVVFIIRTSGPFWTRRPHPLLAASSLGALGCAIAVALSPLGALFGFVDPGAPALAAMLLVSFGYLAAAELTKRFAMRPDRRCSTA